MRTLLHPDGIETRPHHVLSSTARGLHHTINLKTTLDEAREHARADIGNISDPKGQALFETTAEVLGGLLNAYADYELRAPAWR
jgi:hypothetical protein